MAYKYNNPINLGFEKFKLTRKQHNEIIKKRKKNIFTKIEAYYREDSVKLQYFTNWMGIIIGLLFIPFTILIHGLSSIPEILKEVKHVLNQKKYGSFHSDIIYKNRNTAGQVIINDRFLSLESIYKNNKK